LKITVTTRCIRHKREVLLVDGKLYHISNGAVCDSETFIVREEREVNRQTAATELSKAFRASENTSR
jgi:hypothetical protein